MTTSHVLWEFTDADDSDIGFVVGKPRLLKFATAAGTFKWFAVVGGGVNNDSGQPVLFLLDVAKKAGESWSLGTNYYKVVFPTVDAAKNSTVPNGLVNFQAVMGGNKEVAVMFMGDLHGNVWKLNFNNIYPADWSINALSAFNKGTSKARAQYPLFIAKDDKGNIQPITAAPTVAYGDKPNTSLVFVGTGKYLEKNDVSPEVQSAYLLYDNGSASADKSPIVSAISGRNRLQKGSVADASGVVTVPAFILGRALSDLDRSKDKPIASGWFFDFPASRERQINSATLLDGQLVFGTLIPALSGLTGSCNASGGTGKQYAVSMLAGSGESMVSKVGILGETITVEVDGARKYTSKDTTGKIIKSMTFQTFQLGSENAAASKSNETKATSGRMSWRQIHNYQELRNKP